MDPARQLLGYTSDALAAEADFPGGGLWPKIYAQAHRQARFAPEALGLGEAGCAAWRARYALTLPEVVSTQREAHPEHDNETVKLALRYPDGLETELVRVPMARGRYSLCLSSQVGCRMGCGFCETARMGLVRNLSAAEIVSQVVLAQQSLGWQVQNLVFMGMGEPLDNVEALMQALLVLNDRRGLSFGQSRLRICTAGHADGLRRLWSLGWPRLDLSVSLNASHDALRDRLMPINRRFPLKDLQAVLTERPRRKNAVLAVNYALIPGLNNAEADAEGVAEFCAPLGRVLVNLIPYNPGSQPLSRAPTAEEIESFTAALKARGLAVRMRAPKGRSVMAACGQLGNKARRERLPVAP